MEEIEFKPKYPLLLYVLGLVNLVLLEGCLLALLLTRQAHNPGILFSAGFLGLFLLLMVSRLPRVLLRRIRFKAEGIVLERYWLPSETIPYGDVRDLGQTVIRTRQGGISLRNLKNANELRAIFERLMRDGIIKSYQLEGQLVTEEKIAYKSFLPAIMVSLSLYFLAGSFGVLPASPYFREMSYLLFFVPTYFLVYRYKKSRTT